MIVRILGDRLYEVSDSDLPGIERLDTDMDTALSAGDEQAFSTALGRTDLEGQKHGERS